MGPGPIPPHFFPLAGTIGASFRQVNAADGHFLRYDKHLPATASKELEARMRSESAAYVKEFWRYVRTMQEAGQISSNRICDTRHGSDAVDRRPGRGA